MISPRCSRCLRVGEARDRGAGPARSPGDRRGKRPAQRRPGGAEGSGVEPSGSALAGLAKSRGAGGRGALRRAPGLSASRKRGRSGGAGAGGPQIAEGEAKEGTSAPPPRRGDRDRRADSRTARWSGARSASSPGQKNPVVLRQNTSELHLLARLRDEAHRFAITSTASCGASATSARSGGRSRHRDKRKRALLSHFGSLRRIRAAMPEEIAQVEGSTSSWRNACSASSPPSPRSGGAGGGRGGAELDGGALPQAGPETARCCATAMTSPLTPRRQNWTALEEEDAPAPERSKPKPRSPIGAALHCFFLLPGGYLSYKVVPRSPVSKGSRRNEALPKIIPAIARDVIASLMAEGDIEVETMRVADAEMDMAAILKEYSLPRSGEPGHPRGSRASRI